MDPRVILESCTRGVGGGSYLLGVPPSQALLRREFLQSEYQPYRPTPTSSTPETSFRLHRWRTSRRRH